MGVSRQAHDLIRFVTRGFNLKAGGSVQVVPTSSGTRLFVPVHLHFIIATKTGSQTLSITGQTFGNSSTKDNILSSTVTVTSASAVGQLYSGDSLITAAGYDCSSSNGAGGGIWFKGGGGGGAGLTALTCDIHVVGYWVT